MEGIHSLKGAGKRLLFEALQTAAKAVGGRGLGLGRIPFIAPSYKKLYGALHPSGPILLEAQGSQIYVNADDRLHAGTLLTGAWEATETGVFTSLVKPGMTVLDVGANVGYYTLLAARLVSPAGRVFAFEPDPEHCRLLARSLEANQYGNVTICQQAVADKASRAALHVDAQGFGKRSLFAQNIGSARETLEVETVTLDSLYEAGKFGRAVNFIKIDVEGAEGLVLAGAGKLLAENRPAILMEVEPNLLRRGGSEPLTVLKTLESYSYSLFAIVNRDHSIQSLPPDQIVSLSERAGGINILAKPSDSALLPRASGRVTDPVSL